MSTSENLPIEEQRITSMYQLINEVADVIATFDGKFTFHPFSPDSDGVLQFAMGQNVVDLRLWAHVVDENQVEITLGWSTRDKRKQGHRAVYQGLYDKTLCRQSLSTALATWYGQAVRNELGLDEKELP